MGQVLEGDKPMNVSAHHSSSIVADTRHPLDPLTYEELAQTAAILREAFAWSDDLRVETIDIDEPAKEVVRSYRPGDPVSKSPASKSIVAA